MTASIPPLDRHTQAETQIMTSSTDLRLYTLHIYTLRSGKVGVTMCVCVCLCHVYCYYSLVLLCPGHADKNHIKLNEINY